MMHCGLVVFNTPQCHLFLSSEEEEAEDGNGDLIKEEAKTDTVNELSKSTNTECAAESEASASNHSNAGTAKQSKSDTAASSAVTKCDDDIQVNDGEIYLPLRLMYPLGEKYQQDEFLAPLQLK